MPAVTADTLTLARVPRASLGDVERPVVSVTTAPQGYEGEGFPVRRAFAGIAPRLLDPFIMMDQMGEVDYAPGEPKGTSWHPHRGFETVTYIMDGAFQHQDSHGGGGFIADGATQWMTAGGGILHIETPPVELVRSGGTFHGVQLWVNLPGRLKMTDPAYQNLEGSDVTLLASSDGGSLLRVIAGSLPAGDGQVHRGPGSTRTPISLVHASIAPGAQLSLPWEPTFNSLVYVLSGSGRIGAEGRPIRTGQTAVMGAGDHLTVAASDVQEGRHPQLEVLLLGGEPIREPVAQYGPFVMNTRAELQQAVEDFQSGRFGQIPAGALMPHTG
ncbi:MAG: Pirin domain protein [Frankiales bacterium]|jgi:redox-sensitive bicupin YhaK (pirin superfamily)|nr:Pirin domain protein [Frankiales bacterium]